MTTTLPRYDETAIDNATVHQKDTLWVMVNSDQFDQWDLVLSYLRFSRELWAVLRYSYKGKELCLGIADRISELWGEDTIHWKTARKYEDYRTAAFALADLFAADEALARMPKAA